MKKTLSLLAVAGLCTALWGADAALKISSLADFHRAYPKQTKAVADGFSLTVGSGFVELLSKKQLSIDLKKKYQISCEYRLAPGSAPGCRFYFAPVAYTDKGREIRCENQYITEGSESLLTAPVKKGDKIIKVKDASKWQVKYGAVAFYAKKDLSDLPNFDIIRISSAKKEKDCWVITLRTPANKAYPAGTAVRNHRDGASYRYVGGLIKPQAQWQKASRVLTGELRERAKNYITTWRSGTAKSGIIIFTGPGKGVIEIKNIQLTEVK